MRIRPQPAGRDEGGRTDRDVGRKSVSIDPLRFDEESEKFFYGTVAWRIASLQNIADAGEFRPTLESAILTSEAPPDWTLGRKHLFPVPIVGLICANAVKFAKKLTEGFSRVYSDLFKAALVSESNVEQESANGWIDRNEAGNSPGPTRGT